MRALIAPLIAISLSFGATAVAANPSDADSRFEELLRAIDVLPDRPGLERVWPDVRERLLRAAGEVDRDDWTRMRAVSMLSYFPDPGVREALVGLADAAQVEVRRMAIYTAARAFGSPGDEALVAMVERATADPVRAVREHAVRGLRWIDHPAAERALKRLESDDNRPILRDLARQTASRRAQRLAPPRP